MELNAVVVEKGGSVQAMITGQTRKNQRNV